MVRYRAIRVILVLIAAGFAPLHPETAGRAGRESLPVGAGFQAGEGGDGLVSLGPQFDVGVLMIPDFVNQRVMAFEAFSGNLMEADYIPSDPAHLGSPYNVIQGPGGDSFLVADTIDDVILEYSLSGEFIRVFAPAGGADISQLLSPLGMALRPNGNLLVVSYHDPNGGSVAQFDTNGNYLNDFIAAGSGGLAEPSDIHGRPNQDWLVSDRMGESIRRYDYASGAYLSDLVHYEGSTFRQIASAGNGNVLVANDEQPGQGNILEFLPNGIYAGQYGPPFDQYAGVYEMWNGDLLVSAPTVGVYVVHRDGSQAEEKLGGGYPAYVEQVDLTMGLALKKTVSQEPGLCATSDSIVVQPGATVTYCYQATNTGELLFNLHNLSDSDLGQIFVNKSLKVYPGDVAIFSATTTITATTSSTATWSAHNVGSSFFFTQKSSTTVTVADQLVYLPLLIK